MPFSNFPHPHPTKSATGHFIYTSHLSCQKISFVVSVYFVSVVINEVAP